MLKPTMTLETLRNMYRTINVPFKDDVTLRRAILYYRFVQQTHAYFTRDGLPKELEKTRGGYEKIAPALTSPGFLVGLCRILDRYLVDAVNEELKKNQATYTAYFEHVYQTYPQSVNEFMDTYPNIEKALTQIAGLFRHNIVNACTRVLDDWGYIQTTFATDTPESLLDKLTGIQSTGSDFHKGGQQVLILTFSLQRTNKTVRVVYKPSDLEVDCLIIGDTASVNTLRPRFQEQSLMELLNTLIKEAKGLDLQLFPTYKILPISPGSLLTPANDGSIDIRKSYGYIQFLEYEGHINPFEKEKEVCQRFYTLLGQLAAVASAFSLSDLHIQNLIVHNFLPYLIDLENSLTRPIIEFADTEMVGQGAIDSGAINGVVTLEMPFVINKNDTEIIQHTWYSTEKNRLWSSSKALIANESNLKWINIGFLGTMELINVNLKHFGSWFTRLRQGVVVRIVPRGSDKFQNTITFAFSPKNKKSVNEGVIESLQGFLASSYNEWAKDPTNLPPRFLCFQEAHALADMLTIDVPVFYHKLNTCNLLDSWGKIVTVPNTIIINSVSSPVTALLQRATYLGSPPIDAVELHQLSANTSLQRAKELLTQLEFRITTGGDAKQYKMLLELGEVD